MVSNVKSILTLIKCKSRSLCNNRVIPYYIKLRVSDSEIGAPNWEPFVEFQPKINWIGTGKVASRLEPNDSCFSPSVNLGDTSGRVLINGGRMGKRLNQTNIANNRMKARR